MTDKELLYVTTVAECGNLTRAAQQLFIAQPSLTQSIRRLEQELGTPLFQRTGTGMVPTAAGKRYVLAATRIQKLYKDLAIEISELTSESRGKIVVGVTMYLGTMLLPRLLPAFGAAYPGIVVEIFEGNSTQLEHMILSGKIDIALMHKPKRKTSINTVFLAHDRFLIALSPEHPLAREAQPDPDGDFPVLAMNKLAKEPFILEFPEQRIRQVADDVFENAGFLPHIKFTTHSFETACSLAAVGVGAAFMPESYSRCLKPEPEPFYFRLPDELQAHWTLVIGYARGGALSRPCREFAKMMEACMHANGQGGRLE